MAENSIRDAYFIDHHLMKHIINGNTNVLKKVYAFNTVLHIFSRHVNIRYSGVRPLPVRQKKSKQASVGSVSSHV